MKKRGRLSAACLCVMLCFVVPLSIKAQNFVVGAAGQRCAAEMEAKFVDSAQHQTWEKRAVAHAESELKALGFAKTGTGYRLLWGSENVGLNVPVYRQDTETFCGLACMQMIISYKTGHIIPQSQIGARIGYPNGSVYHETIPPWLNTYCGFNDYYGWSSIRDRYISYCCTTLKQGNPVMFLVDPSTVDPDNYKEKGEGHYLVGTGFNTYDELLFSYNDSYTVAQRTVKASLMDQATRDWGGSAQNGYFIWGDY